MRRYRSGCVVFSLLSLLGILHAQSRPATTPAPSPIYDVIIRGGQVLDGAGNPWVNADVGIRGARIVKIARHLPGRARTTIDARGLTVAPGFIDAHTHSDMALLIDGNAESKIRQGVTTEILGEAGSVAPVCQPVRTEESAAVADSGVRRDWKDLNGYFRKLMKQGSSVNVASYVAGGTVRMCAMGAEMRAPTAEELEKMKAYVATGMKQGALGLSTGLIYPPNSYAKTDEIVELARVAAQYGGIYTSHLRSEGAGLLDALKEAITIGEQANIPVHILHLKSAGEKNWGRIRDAVQMVEQARTRGVEVSADQYPYIASSTSLSARVPQWAQDGGRQRFLNRLRDPETRRRIYDEMTRSAYDPTTMVVASVRTDANKVLEGQSIAQIAAARQRDPANAILDLLVEEEGRVSMIYFTMNEEDVRYALRQPWVSIGSDGTAISPNGILGRSKPHPRWYGTHARVLGEYVREQHVLTLEDAVRKMTSLPAAQLGIRDRGLLKEGFFADVVVFDPARIADKATFGDPHHYAEGVRYVLVNGGVVIKDGNHTGERPGLMIYGAGRAPHPARPALQRKVEPAS